MLKVGKIEYINVLPVYFGFIDKAVPFKYEFVEEVPSELNVMLREGKIDISPISSYEFITNSEKYFLFPDFSISSYGQVKSVLFLSRVPIHQLHKKDVWLTKSSMTSRALIEYILKEKFGVEPNYYFYSMKEGNLPKTATAILSIGDDAFKLLKNKNYRFIYDLGQEWYNMYKLPFVFAVWAVRRESFINHPEDIKEIYESFKKSRKYGLSNLQKIAKIYSKKVSLSEKECLDYYNYLNYSLTSLHKKSLKQFAQLLNYNIEIEDFLLPFGEKNGREKN
ncbi:menaquinone biosynthesis protein [Desulfurobacterium atlanticum]|uniref:Chorismate dehydratase n=1 Tax=Desulfurobacterium atlanticum TaxID=240169 RepID=A0A238YIP0_9BACT|nr:menaquinone biosynthesis protein [Desulfurobacterium atlanticum]SNR70668.1 futalosine synthase [Desulfurobacterium atlanticum]